MQDLRLVQNQFYDRQWNAVMLEASICQLLLLDLCCGKLPNFLS